MLEVGQIRMWNNGENAFITHAIDARSKRVEWKYLNNSTNWNERLEYILLNSFLLSSVLRELYE